MKNFSAIKKYRLIIMKKYSPSLDLLANTNNIAWVILEEKYNISNKSRAKSQGLCYRYNDPELGYDVNYSYKDN